MESSSQPNNIKVPNMDEIKDAMKNVNIGEMLRQINNNPDEAQKMMAESLSKITPDMMEKARKLAMGSQGENVRKEMQKRGVNPHELKAQFLQQQRLMRQASKSNSKEKKVVFVTKSRTVKTRTIPEDSIESYISKILKVSTPIQLSCSRLALGPLAGKTIKVWYDPEAKGKNRRSTKILGFPVGSELVIVMEEGDLTEKDFLTVEAQLV